MREEDVGFSEGFGHCGKEFVIFLAKTGYI